MSVQHVGLILRPKQKSKDSYTQTKAGDLEEDDDDADLEPDLSTVDSWLLRRSHTSMTILKHNN